MMLRNRLIAAQSALLVLALSLPQTAMGAGKATFVFRNACESTSSSSSGFGGPLPDAPILIGSDTCKPFTVRDPLTQETAVVKKGDTLDIALVLQNPDAESINRVRAWIAYDPTVLSGSSVQIGSSFPTVTPGESDFSPQQAYIKIGASASSAQKGTSMVVARIRLKVIETDGSSTVLSFYDVGDDPKKHTVAVSGTSSSEKNVLSSPLGSLVIRFTDSVTVSSAASSAPSSKAASSKVSSAASQSSVFGGTVSVASSSSSSANSSSVSSSSTSSIASSVSSSSSSSSSLSASSVSSSSSRSSLNFSSSVSSTNVPLTQQQVQNVRVGTEGTSAYLSWDALTSSQITAYNLYYGTVSGQYIQRRTLDKATTNTTIRNLPQNLTYYFALRGVGANGAESDYSQEISVQIGNPSTSTSPLDGGSVSPPSSSSSASPVPITGTVTPTKGAFAHPGVTPTNGSYNNSTKTANSGTSTTLAMLLLASAVIGTIFAFRRQLLATSTTL